MRSDPLVTIVTPCFNTGQFIEQTIQSVLKQDYPHIEYIIMDGGSTDNTHQIVSRYSGRLRFESLRDTGQAAAINSGFALGRGQLFGFLNADDVYRPGAVTAIVEAFRRLPAAGVIYGNAEWIDERSQTIGLYPTAPYDFGRFQSECFICQPAAFLRSTAFRELNGLNPKLRFALDYDLWIRAGRRFAFARIENVLAASRMHRTNKTLSQRSASFRENIAVVRQHFEFVPFEMIYGYCASLLSRKDLFFETPAPSWAASLLSVPAGLYFNRAHPVRCVNTLARLAWRKLSVANSRPPAI